MREVGVRKALGAKGWHIAVQFHVRERWSSPASAAALGLLLGVGFVHGIGRRLLDQIAALTPAMRVRPAVAGRRPRA